MKRTRNAYGSPPFVLATSCVHYCFECGRRSKHTALWSAEYRNLCRSLVSKGKAVTRAELRSIHDKMQEITFGHNGHCPYCGDDSGLGTEEYCSKELP